jgi:flagellar hook-associated protein 1 FlgK
LSSDTSKIATSSVNGVEGNTDVAINIANVLNQPVSSGVSFQNYVNSFSAGMAQDINNASNQTTIQNQVLSGLGERKASVQGVNLEEEMTNLMMYQKYFQANAKSIKVVSDTLDSVLGIIQ